MKVFFQKDGIFISGKVKEVRSLLLAYAARYRTVKDLIEGSLN